MLRTRVITATILTALLLLGLFLLPPRCIVIAFGLVFTVAAWEWAGFGALRSSAARGLYALCMALLMLAGWHLTAGNWPIAVGARRCLRVVAAGVVVARARADGTSAAVGVAVRRAGIGARVSCPRAPPGERGRLCFGSRDRAVADLHGVSPPISARTSSAGVSGGTNWRRA